MNKKVLSIVVFAIMFLTVGCMNQYDDVVIKENGTATINSKIEMPKTLVDTTPGINEVIPSDAEKTIQTINGVEYVCYTIKKECANMEALKKEMTEITSETASFKNVIASTADFFTTTAITEESAESMLLLKDTIKYEFSITLPRPIVFTNGTVSSSDPCKVQWNIDDYCNKENFYAYSDNSAQYVKIRNDKKAPSVKGVKNKGFYKKASYQFTDESGIEKVTRNNKNVFSSGIIEMDGVYTLISYDLNGNKCNVKFTVDSIKPLIKGAKNNKIYKGNVKIKAYDKYGVKSVKVNGKKQSLKKAKSGIKLKKAGQYRVLVQDKAGNKSTVKFKIKKSKK